MLRPTPSFLTLPLLLVSLAATAAQGAAARRAVTLTGTEGEPPVLYLAPGTETFLLLDAPIERQSVEVEGRARFARLNAAEQLIGLALRTPLLPGERLALRFSYQEGSPRSGVLLLASKPGVVDEVVDVRRPPQAVEACREELAAARERCEAQARELAELKARPAALSPAAMALAGFVGHRGVRGRSFERMCQTEGSGLYTEHCWALGAETWSVVVVGVSNTGAGPWVPAWAELTPRSGGAPRRARSVLATRTPLPPGSTASVAIEVEMPERKEPKEWLTVPHALRVCDAAGERCFSVPVVEL